MDTEGRWVEDIKDVAGVAVQYFNHLFSRGPCSRIEECIEAIPHKVTSEMQQILTDEFNEDEIKATLFQMGPTKAPGPDGMNALFYQKFWHIVSDTVVSAVLEFLNNGHMMPELNHTHIVLIPKIKNPAKMFDFRPISLCIVIYKIIAKVLANRLKQVLPHIIAPT